VYARPDPSRSKLGVNARVRRGPGRKWFVLSAIVMQTLHCVGEAGGDCGSNLKLACGPRAEVTKRDHATAGVRAVNARRPGVGAVYAGTGEVNVFVLIVYVMKYTIGGRFLWRNAKLEVACRGLSFALA